MTYCEALAATKAGQVAFRPDMDGFLTIENGEYETPYIKRPKGDSFLLSWLTAQDIMAHDWIIQDK